MLLLDHWPAAHAGEIHGHITTLASRGALHTNGIGWAEDLSRFDNGQLPSPSDN